MAEEKKTIEVPLEFLKALEEKVERLEKDRDMLLTIADRKSLSSYFIRHKEHESNIVRIRELYDKVVIGWRSVKDVVQKIGPQKWLEDQRTEIIFEDNTTEEMPQVDFELNHKKIPCRRVGVITDEQTGKVAFKLVRLDNGKEYTIDTTFVN